MDFKYGMYRYADGNGNVYVLQLEDNARLHYESACPTSAQAQATRTLEKPLSQCDYMRLMSAFSLAIDNRICQRELRNASTSVIIANQDGQQRRYFLSPGSVERRELEGLLGEVVGI